MESPLLGLVLDSTVTIAAERKKQLVAELVAAIFEIHGRLDLSLSPVSVAELVHGVYRARTVEAGQRRRLYVEDLISLIPVHPVTSRTSWIVGRIEGQQAAQGNVLPFNDLMIAASAIEQGYAVLTSNLRHFQRIPGLRVIPF